MPNKFGEQVVVVEPNINDVKYSRAIKRILNDNIVSNVIVTFFDSADSNICGEIKSTKIKAGKKEEYERVLIINENSSYDSVTAALNWVASSKTNKKNNSLVKSNSSIKFRSAY